MSKIRDFLKPIGESLNQVGLHLSSFFSVDSGEKSLSPKEHELLMEFQELVGTVPLNQFKRVKDEYDNFVGYFFEQNNRRFSTSFAFHSTFGTGFDLSMPMRVFSLNVTELGCGHVVLKLTDTPTTRSIFLRLEGRFETEKNDGK